MENRKSQDKIEIQSFRKAGRSILLKKSRVLVQRDSKKIITCQTMQDYENDACKLLIFSSDQMTENLAKMAPLSNVLCSLVLPIPHNEVETKISNPKFIFPFQVR